MSTTVKCPLFFLFVAAVLVGTVFSQGFSPSAFCQEPTETPPVELLFSDSNDLQDTWGQLHFSVTPVSELEACSLPDDFEVIACFPLEGDIWEVFGHTRQVPLPDQTDKEMFDRVVAWKLLRSTTQDGIHYTDPEVVYEPEPSTYTDHYTIARNPDRGEYLLLNLKMDSAGFRYTATFSEDGRHWSEYPETVFRDGDAMSLFWSEALHRYVCVSKSLQPYRKHFIDHGGTTPGLKDDSLRDRRVLVFRTSVDGRHWEPSVDMQDVWNRNGHKAPVPAGFMVMPDEQDPPELEFYSGRGFWYKDRAYMMVLNYAASPVVHGHAPQLDNEWWTSLDGLRWNRPARGVNVLEAFPGIPRLESNPLVISGRILFPRNGKLHGLPENRICGVSARTNGEFSTQRFVMPEGQNLYLNASIPSAERPFARQQAYVTVAVLDEHGTVIPGYEEDQCVIAEKDDIRIPLQWGEKDAQSLAGQNIRLRFTFRSATLFAVTSEK